MNGRTFRASACAGSALGLLLSVQPMSASARANVVGGLSVSAPAVLYRAGGPNHLARDSIENHATTSSKRYYHGIVNRFSAGGSSTFRRMGINDVTMKRGVVGTGAMNAPARASSPLIRRPR